MFKLHNSFITIVIISTVMGVSADRVPSTDDIEDYDDPVLREVFASSRNQKPTSPAPLPVPSTGRVPQPRPRVPSTDYQRVVYPANQVPAYQAGGQLPFEQPPPPAPYYPQQPSPFAQLAVQGAQTFLSGAQAVGNAFGFGNYGSQSPYEVPVSGGFFG